MKQVTTSKFIVGRQVIITGNEQDEYFTYLASSAERFEQDIVNLLAISLNDDSIALDVGANIGYITLTMAILAKKGKVYSFEPSKDAYSLLKDNITNNKLDNVVTRNLGLSDKKTSATISYAKNNMSGGLVSDSFTQSIKGHKNSPIKLEELDDLYKRLQIKKCDFMKVDIEGHELQFLKGARGFIKKFKPLTIIEANHWCLNIFNRTSLPDFIDELHQSFPYMFAFDSGEFYDLEDNEARYRFFYENTVNNRFTNLYCGFDYNQMIAKLCLGFSDALKKQVSDEEELILKLEEVQNKLQEVENAKLYKTIRRLQKRVKRIG